MSSCRSGSGDARRAVRGPCIAEAMRPHRHSPEVAGLPHAGTRRRTREASARPCRKQRRRRGSHPSSARRGSHRSFQFPCCARPPHVERQLRHRDKVLVVAVDERRRWDPFNDGDPSADEREALGRSSISGSIMAKPLSCLLPQGLGEHGAGAGEPGHHRADWRRGRFGDFAIGEAVHIAHDERLEKGRGKARDRLPQALAILQRDERLFGIGRGVVALAYRSRRRRAASDASRGFSTRGRE